MSSVENRNTCMFVSNLFFMKLSSVVICSEGYEADKTKEPWLLKVIPWRDRSDKVSDEDVQDGKNYTAIHKKTDLDTLTGEQRRKFMDAKRQRKRKQTHANKLQQLTE